MMIVETKYCSVVLFFYCDNAKARLVLIGGISLRRAMHDNMIVSISCYVRTSTRFSVGITFSIEVSQQ